MIGTVIVVLYVVGVLSILGAWKYHDYYWAPVAILYAILGFQLFAGR